MYVNMSEAERDSEELLVVRLEGTGDKIKLVSMCTSPLGRPPPQPSFRRDAECSQSAHNELADDFGWLSSSDCIRRVWGWKQGPQLSPTNRFKRVRVE